MDPQKLAELKAFIRLVDNNPATLADPSLRFFRDYLESLGATLPVEAFENSKFESQTKEQPRFTPSKKPEEEPEEPEEEEEAEIVESDVEFDDVEDFVEPDSDPHQKIVDINKEVTDEDRENAQLAKARAMEVLADGNLEEAVEHLSKAIEFNPTSALLYGNRAAVYVKLKKPNAAIRDCEAALQINPDSARAYKSRGEAKAILGQWEEAAKDLRLASSLDYDDEVASFLKIVEPKAHRLEEHRRKYQRLRQEREDRLKQKKKAAAQAKYDKQKEEEERAKKSSKKPTGFPGPMPAGMGGGMPFGGMPAGMGGGMPSGMGGGMPAGMGGGAGMPDMSSILNDPELMAALSDPEVSAALQDVMANPANMVKHQSNPKVATVLNKMMSKFGGGQ